MVSTRFSPGFIKPGLQVYEDLLIHDLYLAEYFFDNQIKEIVKLDLKKIGEQTTEIKVEFTVHDAIWQSETSWEEQTLKRELKITGKNGFFFFFKRPGGDEVTMKVKNQPIKVAELSAKESSLASSINHFLQLNYQTAKENYSAYLRHTRMLESLK